MSVRFPFYELASRRQEADGSLRRCFRAADESDRALFVWQLDDTPIVQAQLLLGDETFVEWRGTRVTAGDTTRGASDHTRHKGVRVLAAHGGPSRLLARASEVLLASDLPAPVIEALVRRLHAASAAASTPASSAASTEGGDAAGH